ncbi:Cytochrome c biogenesis ATP-binding export protein CcmA [Jannaschia seosinensis]|uniref:Cytochrome c biogenesis ATP-binding export protein CcmA n=1 Tax=Jannaschia seosinensis TaxID=313367 RepID=A0A0M7B6N3_9RHOB|nr:heme ABC exporter ATP-binding protein CcmA [Jannaschia seosinensis]CUH11291.1 Cytochrome c biogenesis ATP-binding export protein CcmA [Jannaschia seosinensis]
MTLSVTNLSCRRGEAVVLRGVRLSVARGAALVLRGPNGAGKTTLLRTLAGLTPPVSGDVAPERCAYAGHADGLKAQLTVGEALRFWAAIFGGADVGPAVRAFDLEPLLDRRAAELSAGQKRRAGLARLVLTGRPVWLLDEPTVSLDTDNVTRFAAAIRAHLAGGGSAIIATHVDLGLTDATTLDVGQFAAGTATMQDDPFAEAVE